MKEKEEMKTRADIYKTHQAKNYLLIMAIRVMKSYFLMSLGFNTCAKYKKVT